MSEKAKIKLPIAKRFRGFLPVVVDLETGGFNSRDDALLEIAAIVVEQEDETFKTGDTYHAHVEPFKGANIDPKSLEVNNIKVTNPFRQAKEEKVVLTELFEMVKTNLEKTGCTRAILVGHNAFFDLTFLQAAASRCKFKTIPFHMFSTIDTVSLGGLIYHQTVLAKACKAADIEFDIKSAHGALYDTEKTTELFCNMLNRWHNLAGWPEESNNG